MIVTCDGCETRYLLGDEKVPARGIRVRCPKCRFIWRLMPAVEDSVFEISSNKFGSEAIAPERPAGGWNSEPQHSTAVMSEPAIDPVEKEIEISNSIPEKAIQQEEISETPEQKKKRERTKRLARVFVSDILVYNEEKRNQGLANGTLMTLLGPEIKKAWEAYKEKVGADVKESNDYFRNALNEILANGQEVF